ncbi:MAG: hypothetical protein EZS28_054897, partial [Streblomastix strix]
QRQQTSQHSDADRYSTKSSQQERKSSKPKSSDLKQEVMNNEASTESVPPSIDDMEQIGQFNIPEKIL